MRNVAVCLLLGAEWTWSSECSPSLSEALGSILRQAETPAFGSWRQITKFKGTLRYPASSKPARAAWGTRCLEHY